MKPFCLIVPFLALGLVLGGQEVNAQNPQNADLNPPYLSDEAMAEEHIGDEELIELQEGEVTERGISRFRLRPRKRITIPNRRKRKIIRPPVSSRPSPSPKTSSAPQAPVTDPPLPPLTERELIHERIDVHAQRSLRRISKTHRVAEARLIFESVKSGALGGIYKADTKVPSLRAVRMGTAWFNLIPKGQDSICLTNPTKPGEKPILVFRKSLVEPRTKGPAMDAALLRYRELCKAAILTVKVRKGSQPVNRADVDVLNASSGINAENCSTNIAGHCRFALPHNSTSSVVVLHASQRKDKTVRIGSEDAVEVEFNFGSNKPVIPPRLGRQTGVLLVTARGKGRPLRGAEVRIIGASESQPVFFGVTGNGGTASFAPTPGVYTVSVTKGGFNFAFQKVKIQAGRSTPVFLKLRPQTKRLKNLRIRKKHLRPR